MLIVSAIAAGAIARADAIASRANANFFMITPCIALAAFCPCHTLCELLPKKGGAWGFYGSFGESRTACHAWGTFAPGFSSHSIRRMDSTLEESGNRSHAFTGVLCNPYQHAPTGLISRLSSSRAKHRLFRFSDLRAQEGRGCAKFCRAIPQ